MSLIARKGDEHEKAFLNLLRQKGVEVVQIERGEDAPAQTIAAMRRGVPVIFQGALTHQSWGGYPDFLAGQHGPSKLGDHFYEVWDTKLARSPKPYFLVQLCAYADMLEQTQGVRPPFIEVILGNGDRKRFATNHFFFYYRELKKAFQQFQGAFDLNKLPDPGLCGSHGRWSELADQVLAKADHLSGVARITRSQIFKLQEAGIETTVALAHSKLTQVAGLPVETLARLKTQARLQIASCGHDNPVFELSPPDAEDPRRGLALLPPASEGDVFFDMEGYPLLDGGLEYLFGAVYRAGGECCFTDWWGHDSIQEKIAFEQFVDWAFDRWQTDPSMHIYHYAAYEVSAMRRLMGRYATREHEVDELLRSEVFVDLYTVVRQGLVVGTPSYSLKDVERVYLPKRSGTVKTAGGSVVAYQLWLDEQDGQDWNSSTILREIRDYNRLDCESLFHLAEWLRTLQVEHSVNYVPLHQKPADTPEDGGPRAENPAKALTARLLAEITEGGIADPERRRVQVLLAWLLEFHWREAKPVFWRMFHRRDMTDPELVLDLDCLGALVRTTTPRRQVKRSWEYEYRFDPDQDTKLHEGSCCIFQDLSTKCEIESFDRDRGLLTIKLGSKAPEPPAQLNLIPDEFVSAKAISDSVYRYVSAWADGAVPSQAVDDLIYRRTPRVRGHTSGPLIDGSSSLAAMVRVATALDGSTLCIQGPPGTGKTFTAAAIIAGLLKKGKRIGITATSHSAIMNLMRNVATALEKADLAPPLFKVGGDGEDELIESGRVTQITSSSASGVMQSGPLVMGGTAWLFSREDLAGRFDCLVIDEAGQFSLANAVATGMAATNLILVGDQMQLSQPIQGSHPGESGKSVLDYLLQDNATVPPDMGIFLNVTWRMHPHICQFISEAVYDSRLTSRPETAKQEIRCVEESPTGFHRTYGIAFVDVPHQFNSQCSAEEVDAIELVVQQLQGRCVVAADGTTHGLTLDDILFVAPYNMQVRRLQQRLGPSARVGSVDRFQGQEAPVVIVSMCASSLDECPRGIDFLMSKNRFNVAISRAKCLAIVVGCRSLMSGRCSTIEHMEMTNLYCWLAAYSERPFATE